jgi:hypothetical protein
MAAAAGLASRFRYLPNIGDTFIERPALQSSARNDHAGASLRKDNDSSRHPQVIVKGTDEWVRPWLRKSNPEPRES